MNNYLDTHGTHGAEVLSDPRWKIRRKEILERDQFRCVNCSSEKNLEIHLRQYHYSMALKQFKQPWEYESNLLVTLCESCHRDGHSLYQVPVKQIQ